MFNLKLVLLFVGSIKMTLSAPGDLLAVKIKDGLISGVEGRTEDRQVRFWAFLGIPYASPPVGNLRFMPPQPVKHWKGVLETVKHGSSCMQTFLHNEATPISEDCLFLNVYTTAFIKPNLSLLPVMVYFHGGGFITGTGDLGMHGADRFLENGVILVSFNYRLGAFGFLCTLDGASPGNYGLKDQIAALKWVKRNIAIFGGDVRSITIFGQGAGAASIHYLLQSELTQGLYHAAITESGSTLSSWAVAQNPRQTAFNIGVMNLIFTDNTTKLVNELRQVRPLRLLGISRAINSLQQSPWNGLTWAPCIEYYKKNAVVTGYNYPNLKSGNFNRVPLMTGFNSLEARDSNVLSWVGTLYDKDYNFDPRLLVPPGINKLYNTDAGLKIKNFYFKNESIRNDSKFIKFASDTLFVRPINKHVDLMSRYIPVYYYRFTFTGGPAHNKFHKSHPQGASHAEELDFLFNQFDDTPKRNKSNSTPEAIVTQNRMVRLWTNFAKYFDPTSYTDVLSYLKWPGVHEFNDNLAYINIDRNLTVHSDPEKSAIKFWDDLYNKYGLPPYNSY